MSNDPDQPKIYRKIDADDPMDIVVPVVIELRFVSSVPADDAPRLEKAVDALRDLAIENLAQHGFRAMTAGGLVRPITQDELLQLLPRKKHFTENGHAPICSYHVKAKHLVTIEGEVTCKTCLRILEAKAPKVDPRQTILTHPDQTPWTHPPETS